MDGSDKNAECKNFTKHTINQNNSSIVKVIIIECGRLVLHPVAECRTKCVGRIALKRKKSD
jgi:hypothetical protein